jgi:hypothetical protein
MSRSQAWQGPEEQHLLGCYDYCVSNRLKPQQNLPSLMLNFGYERTWISFSARLGDVVKRYNATNTRSLALLRGGGFAALQSMPKDMRDRVQAICDKINSDDELQLKSQGSLDLVGGDGDVAMSDSSKTVITTAEALHSCLLD